MTWYGPYQISDTEGKLVGKMPDLSAEPPLASTLYATGRASSNKSHCFCRRQGRATTLVDGRPGRQRRRAGGSHAAQDWPGNYTVSCLLMAKAPRQRLLLLLGFNSRKISPRDPLYAHSNRNRYADAAAARLAMAAKIAGDPVVGGFCGDGRHF